MSAPNVDLPERMNAATYFVDANVEAGRGEKIAICDAGDGSTYTYNDVLAMTNRTGSALKALGLRREERVMLLMFDSPEFAFCFFGAIKIGAVPVPVNTLLKPADYEYLINDSRARALVVSEPLLANIRPIRDRLVYLEEIIVVGQAGDGELSYRDLVSTASAELSPEILSRP
jgi:acyl-coenzyme A synthetase/AMP-(fatty) acid ligase